MAFSFFLSKTLFLREAREGEMAESLVSNVVSQLTNLLVQEAVFLGGARDQIVWVNTQLKLLQGFLKDADSRRKRGDARLESWIREMRGVAYEMEDVIDSIKYMGEWRHQRRGCMGSISRYSHKPRELITLHKITSRIEKIRIKIESISKSKDDLGIANLGESSAVDESSQSLRQSSPHSIDDDVDVIGLENDKKILVSQLLDQSQKTRCVISIVGMGGVGKTTLARKVCNDPEIKEHFKIFAWVSVSQTYQVVVLVKDIMKQVMVIEKEESRKKFQKNVTKKTENEETTARITVEELEKMSEEEARNKLRDFLEDKKYFVVMDDVWTTDVWRRMEGVFPDHEDRGSKILLTTRTMAVANRARSCFPPYELRTLDDRESLELLCRKAIPSKQDLPTELKELAHKLAKRCGGLPLALVALGGILSERDTTYDAWSSVARSIDWEDSGDGKECLDILGLSYKDLPYLLKPCFLYIAAFPEDSIISASKLIRLWVAEGFIPEERSKTMEEVARDWLDKLVQRCMIQVVQRSEAHGWVKRIRIHDMFHEFGRSEARTDGFLDVRTGPVAASNHIPSHRAAFYDHVNIEFAESSPHLRTFLGFNLVLEDSCAVGRFLNRLNLLRVLDLEGASDLKKLPKQIGNMIHLRYLGLRNTGLKKLPSSVGHLLNLQTLDVRSANISRLPKSLWKIRTLRHVYIDIDVFLCAPIIGEHQNLQTLKIREHNVSLNFIDGIYLLWRFIKLWGTTVVIQRTWDESFIESSENAFKKMDNLISLDIAAYPINGDVIFSWTQNLYHLCSLTLEGRLSFELQQFPNSNQFPPELTKLILRYSTLEHDQILVLGKLPNLRLLHLDDDAYRGKSLSCSAGDFPRLQRLILERLYKLEEWRVEVGAMPNLTHLTVIHCVHLKMLPEGSQHMTTLQELKLIEMSREFDDRVRNEIRYIPSIIFEKEGTFL